MSLVVVGSEGSAFGALPWLKCSPTAFRGKRRWLHSVFFLSFFLFAFFFFSCSLTIGGKDFHPSALPRFWPGHLSWGDGLLRFLVWPLELGIQTPTQREFTH